MVNLVSGRSERGDVPQRFTHLRTSLLHLPEDPEVRHGGTAVGISPAPIEHKLLSAQHLGSKRRTQLASIISQIPHFHNMIDDK